MERFIQGSVVLIIVIFAAVIPAPAQASTQDEGVSVEITEQRCGVMVTYRNQTPWHFWGDYRSDDRTGAADQALPDLPADPAGYGEAHNHGVEPDGLITSGPLAGQPWGRQYQPVHLAPGATVTVEVQVTEARTVAAGVRRGVDQTSYVDWIEAGNVQPCSDPDVDYQDICEGTLVRISNREGAAAKAQFFFDPRTEGVAVIVVVDPGRSPEPLFYGPDAGEIVVEDLTNGQLFTHNWAPPASGDCQAAARAAGWSDGGQAPGTGGSLALTGSPATLLGAGALALLLLGGGLFLLARRRRVTFTA